MVDSPLRQSFQILETNVIILPIGAVSQKRRPRGRWPRLRQSYRHLNLQWQLLEQLKNRGCKRTQSLCKQGPRPLLSQQSSLNRPHQVTALLPRPIKDFAATANIYYHIKSINSSSAVEYLPQFIGLMELFCDHPNQNSHHSQIWHQ